MKALDTGSSTQNSVVSQSEHGRGHYAKVFDGRKRRIRGLWERNGSFYAQLTLPDESTGTAVVRRVRLDDADGNPVATVADAVKGMAKLKVQREDNQLTLTPKRTPTFREYAADYIAHLEAVKTLKRPATIRTEKSCINRLNQQMGDLRLRQINLSVARGYIGKRAKQSAGARAVNLELVTLRNILKVAVEEKLLPAMPLEGIKWLDVTTEKRGLVRNDDIDRLCAEAVATVDTRPKYNNGQELADFIRLMAYSGGRWSETLRLRWDDVSVEQRQLTFGGDGLAKNHESREVDFNAKLEAHLVDMKGRRQPDSAFLFPSPRRGNKDVPCTTFNKTLVEVRRAAGLPKFTCHVCRHYFISMAVMNGIDYLTIAKWVGHQDGGVLIGSTYGHLNNEHTQRQAGRMTFEPVVVKAAVNQ